MEDNVVNEQIDELIGGYDEIDFTGVPEEEFENLIQECDVMMKSIKDSGRKDVQDIRDIVTGIRSKAEYYLNQIHGGAEAV